MSVVAVRQAPHALVQYWGGDPTVSPAERIFHSAAKKLYPRLALFEALARFKDEHEPREPSSDSICEARRAFLDSFAYLCDIEKGGKTVTAAALQKLPHSNFLWLAANEGIRGDVKIYAENILQKLMDVKSSNQRAIQDDIFQLVVEKCKFRIEYYKVEMQKYAETAECN